MSTYKIFVSSPGDVRGERDIAERVISRVEAWFGGRVELHRFFWEHEPMLATRGDFQAQIPEPGNYDLFVCILWSRLGTRLHPERYHRPDGTPYASGTEYEFELAMQAFEVTGHPDLLIYRRKDDPPFPMDSEEKLMRMNAQVRALQRFCDKWFTEGDSDIFKTGYLTYENGGQFELNFEKHLKKLARLLKK